MKAHEIGRELGAVAMGQSMRLGQLLSNAIGVKCAASGTNALDELFYMPDEALLETVKAYARSKQHAGSPTT